MIEVYNWHYIYSPSHIRTDLQHYYSRRANLNPVCIVAYITCALVYSVPTLI